MARPSLTLIPVFIPILFASIDAARMQPPGEVKAATATGFPRKNGFACCSIVAKQELRSICMMQEGFELNSIAYLLQFPAQAFSVQSKFHCQGFRGNRKNVIKNSAFTEGIMQANLFDFVDTVFPFNPLRRITHSDYYFFVNYFRHD